MDPMGADTLDLRLNLKDGGIWANFSPYPGAMPVFVNTANPSKTVIYWRYSSCMKKPVIKNAALMADRCNFKIGR